MIGIVRVVGLLNAAVWLGGSVFALAVVPLTIGSTSMHQLLGQRYYPYFSGAIGQLATNHFWTLHLVCGSIAVLHLAAVSLYFGKGMARLWSYMLAALMMLGILEKAWIQPRLERTHIASYAVNRPPIERQAAARLHSNWLIFNRFLDFAAMLSLSIYVWRVANPQDAARFVSTAKYRG